MKSHAFTKVFELYTSYRLKRMFHDVRLVADPSFDTALSQGPSIITLNHVCWWDPLILVQFNRRLKLDGTCLMDKANLDGLKFFSKLGAVPLDRSSPKTAYSDLKRSLATLTQARQTLVIFPQGVQRPSHLPLHFERGVAYLAKASGLPVIPVGLRYDFSHTPRPIVHLAVGAVQHWATTSSNTQFLARLEDETRKALDRVDELLIAETPAPSLLRASAPSDRAGALPAGTAALQLLTVGEKRK